MKHRSHGANYLAAFSIPTKAAKLVDRICNAADFVSQPERAFGTEKGGWGHTGKCQDGCSCDAAMALAAAAKDKQS